MVAFSTLVFGVEIGAIFWRPYSAWIPTAQLAVAVAFGAWVVSAAHRRIPQATRKQQSILKLTVNCICGNHLRCIEHIACPCGCHDNHIKRMVAWPAPAAASAGMRNP